MVGTNRAGLITQALKYGGNLAFKALSDRLGNAAIYIKNFADKVGIPQKLSEKGLDFLLNAIHNKNLQFNLSQIGKAIIPVSPFDYPYKPASTYQREPAKSNAAYGLSTLGATPSHQNSTDLAPFTIGDRQEVLEQEYDPRGSLDQLMNYEGIINKNTQSKNQNHQRVEEILKQINGMKINGSQLKQREYEEYGSPVRISTVGNKKKTGIVIPSEQYLEKHANKRKEAINIANRMLDTPLSKKVFPRDNKEEKEMMEIAKKLIPQKKEVKKRFKKTPDRIYSLAI